MNEEGDGLLGAQDSGVIGLQTHQVYQLMNNKKDFKSVKFQNFQYMFRLYQFISCKKGLVSIH